MKKFYLLQSRWASGATAANLWQEHLTDQDAYDAAARWTFSPGFKGVSVRVFDMNGKEVTSGPPVRKAAKLRQVGGTK